MAQAGVKRLILLKYGTGQGAVLDIAARDLRIQHDRTSQWPPGA